MSRATKSKIYDNCIVLDKSGAFHCYIDQDRLDWYLRKGLANQISEKTIQLNFTPKGPGSRGNKYYSIKKKNNCVCCNAEENLTRHHVVPTCYKRHLPRDKKAHRSYDVVAMCFNCHMRYEMEAFKFKERLFKEVGIDIHKKKRDVDLALKAKRSAIAILERGSDLPKERREELLWNIRFYLDKLDITDDEIDYLANRKYAEINQEYRGQYKSVIDKIGWHKLAVRWRQHFVDTMEPQYMPENWSIEGREE